MSMGKSQAGLTGPSQQAASNLQSTDINNFNSSVLPMGSAQANLYNQYSSVVSPQTTQPPTQPQEQASNLQNQSIAQTQTTQMQPNYGEYVQSMQQYVNSMQQLLDQFNSK